MPVLPPTEESTCDKQGGGLPEQTAHRAMWGRCESGHVTNDTAARANKVVLRSQALSSKKHQRSGSAFPSSYEPRRRAANCMNLAVMG